MYKVVIVLPGERLDCFFAFPESRADRPRSLPVAAKDLTPAHAVGRRGFFDRLYTYEGFFSHPGRRLLAILGQGIERGTAESLLDLNTPTLTRGQPTGCLSRC